MYSWKRKLPFCSGRLQKISENIYETGICNISKNLNWNEIAINEERLKKFDLDPPVHAVYIPRNGKPKPSFDKTVQRTIVDPKNKVNEDFERYTGGYAVVSEYDNYIREMLKESNVVFNTTPDIFQRDVYSL